MPSVCFSVYNKSTTYILFYVTVTTYNKRKMWKKFSCVFRKKKTDLLFSRKQNYALSM